MKGQYKNSSGIVRAKDYHLSKRIYLFEGAKVGDKYRCRDGSIVTLTTKLRNGRYGSHYVTPDAGGEEYGVLWDGLCVWAEAKNGEPITKMKDVVEKI